MNIQKGFLIAGLTALLVFGCSEEKKREAARLEARLKGDTMTTTDVTAAPSEPSPDSVKPQLASMDTTTTSTTNPSPSGGADSSVASRDTAISAKVEREVDSAQDPATLDVNAIPEENGRRRSDRMPPQLRDLFTVQVASSPSESFSRTVVDSFLSRGYEAYLATVTVGEKTYYRVRVGKFASRSEASAVSSEINGKYTLQSWVDKIVDSPDVP
jgi:septal ring-binding cell division protein DamX